MSATQLENFDIRIRASQQGHYVSEVIQSPTGEADIEFSLQLASEKWRTFFDLSGRDIPPFSVRTKQDSHPIQASDLQSLGEDLYRSAFDGDVGACLQASLVLAEQRRFVLRIRLHFSRDVPELADLPWEYLFAPELGGYVALSNHALLVRYIPLRLQQQSLKVKTPLTILSVLANPKGLPELRAEQEWTHLQRVLAIRQASYQVRLERLDHATLAALHQRLRKGDVNILHFIGHGYFDIDANASGLVLEDADGDPELVEAKRLCDLFGGYEGLRLIFLNACESARGGWSDYFAGVAQQLVREGIPAVLAMQFSITDTAARTLAQEFYESIADGYAVDSAVARARKRLSLEGDALEWGAPILFSRSNDNRIIELVDAGHYVRPKPFEPEMVLIPAGRFWMGASPGDDDAESWESPAGEVHLDAYLIGKYSITNEQYWEFVKETGHPPPRINWNGLCPSEDRLRHPVVQISWNDAQAYCQWLSETTRREYRLPSEAQWEKAARGDSDRRIYLWGDVWDRNQRGWRGNGIMDIDSCGAQSPFGCIGMVGNIKEWTNTLWGNDMHEARSDFPYPWQPDSREASLAKTDHARCYRVLRGAAFDDRRCMLRCSARDWDATNERGARYGVRIALLLPT